MAAQQSDTDCDVLVIGTGASGLTAAVTAAKGGLKVLIVEKESEFGGTSATSGGMLWIPGSRHSPAVAALLGQPEDSRDAVRTYLAGEVGNYADWNKIDAYLENGPKMVEFLEAETEVKFIGMDYPDYHADRDGGRSVRSICSVDYQASKLGPEI